jgi:hypothetical protein
VVNLLGIAAFVVIYIIKSSPAGETERKKKHTIVVINATI